MLETCAPGLGVGTSVIAAQVPVSPEAKLSIGTQCGAGGLVDSKGKRVPHEGVWRESIALVGQGPGVEAREAVKAGNRPGSRGCPDAGIEVDTVARAEDRILPEPVSHA